MEGTYLNYFPNILEPLVVEFYRCQKFRFINGTSFSYVQSFAHCALFKHTSLLCKDSFLSVMIHVWIDILFWHMESVTLVLQPPSPQQLINYLWYFLTYFQLQKEARLAVLISDHWSPFWTKPKDSIRSALAINAQNIIFCLSLLHLQQIYLRYESFITS